MPHSKLPKETIPTKRYGLDCLSLKFVVSFHFSITYCEEVIDLKMDKQKEIVTPKKVLNDRILPN